MGAFTGLAMATGTMKKILYVSTKKSMNTKRNDVEVAFGKRTTVKPIWYPTQNLIKYPNLCSINIYDFDDQYYRGLVFDYVMESALGLTPSSLKFSAPDIINTNFNSITTGNSVIADIFPSPQVQKMRVFDPEKFAYVEKEVETDKCIHEWVEYTGLFESFEYCKKCEEKKK